jgi:hypothetical protein
MDSVQTEIARFLAEKAMRQTRATYQQVGDSVGWNHPTGRGLDKSLEVVLHALHDRGLPPLTAILVKRGERHPGVYPRSLGRYQHQGRPARSVRVRLAIASRLGS